MFAIGAIRAAWLRLATAVICAVGAAAGPAWAQSPPPGKMVEVNGVELHYTERGRGEPLLLLHGFGGCAEDLTPFADALAKEFRVISVDLRGHGWSTNPTGVFSMRQSAEDIADFLEKLAIPKARAIGVSAGGMTLLHLAVWNPDRIESMVLVGASTHFVAETRAIAASANWDELPPPVQAFYSACAKRGGDQVEQLLAQFRSFATSYEDMTFTPPTLATIKARTLIVHGDRDDFFPVGIPVTMYDAIPGAALWIVPGGDHVPIYDDQMPEFLRVVRRFLAGPKAKGD